MTIRQIFAKHSNLTSLSEGDYEHMMDEEDFTNAAKELIEYHVIQALKQASEQVTTKLKEDVQELSMNDEWTEIDKDSILNSYPLTIVK